MDLALILYYFIPVVIAAATVEGVVFTFALRRDYDWRAYWASVRAAPLRSTPGS